VLAGACLREAPPEPASGSAEREPAADTGLVALEGAILSRVNAHRESRGLPGLERRGEIERLARAHSADMARGAVGFGHAGFRARTRVIGKGLPLRAGAENISRHARPLAEIPAAALARWLASSVHRRNLEGDYQLTGVGAARAQDGRVYVTQLFVAIRR
jgi:uncharacterized protein YkwD